MHVVQMRGIITIIAYRMFPEPPLPNSAFASGPANRRQSLGCRQRFGKCNLDCFPANRIVGVTRRKCPYTVQMIGQNDPSINVKWMPGAGSPHGGPQSFYMIGQQAEPAFQQVYGKEVSSTGNAIAAIVGHMRIVARICIRRKAIRRKALRFSALRYFPALRCGGRRCAFRRREKEFFTSRHRPACRCAGDPSRSLRPPG